MKKLFIVLGVVLVTADFSACTKTDNYPGPDSAFQGNIIDSVTGKNLLTETGGIQIEMKQLSWSDNPDPYYIPSKPDGTFEDTRIFSGHYSVIPTQGAFWPVDSIVTDIKGATSHNFTVVPYLEVVNLQSTQAADSLVMTFQLQAPRTNGLPPLMNAVMFVNNTPYVGGGAFIQDFYNQGGAQVTINSTWNSAIAGTTYRTVVHKLQAGWTYYSRIGVRVNDSYQKYDLSDVVKVVMPPGK